MDHKDPARSSRNERIKIVKSSEKDRIVSIIRTSKYFYLYTDDVVVLPHNVSYEKSLNYIQLYQLLENSS